MPCRMTPRRSAAAQLRRVMLGVGYKLERDDPRPGNSNEREAALIEYSLRHSILVLDRGVGNRIVCVPWAIRWVKRVKREADL